MGRRAHGPRGGRPRRDRRQHRDRRRAHPDGQHGLVPAARAALAGGASWLGVAQLGEALALRGAGVDVPLLCWLAGTAADLAPAVAAGVDLSVSSPEQLAAVCAAAGRAGRSARVHLKVDTGLGRGGATAAAWADLVDAAMGARATGAVQWVGAWSHLALADVPDHPANAAQREAFEAALAVAERAGARLEVRHLANSAATLTAPAAHYDLVRPGTALYGLSPGPRVGSATQLGLVGAMTLRTRLALVKDVDAGQGVSYGLTYVTPAASRLALVPLGYGDGVPRAASGSGPVAVAGGAARVAGRVCMDQFVVDLAGLPGATAARAGDDVVLFGDAAAGVPTADDWADAAGTIGYEVTSRISARVPRRWTGSAGVPAAPEPRS